MEDSESEYEVADETATEASTADASTTTGIATLDSLTNSINSLIATGKQKFEQLDKLRQSSFSEELVWLP